MKLIQAMKRVQRNKDRVAELLLLVKNNCSNLSIATPQYEDMSGKIAAWQQEVFDLGQENISLLTRLNYTNIVTPVTIELGDKSVTKPIAEWIYRRREYANMDYEAWNALTDRGLREQHQPGNADGVGEIHITIQRHFDAEKRDAKKSEFKDEPLVIDAELEVVNAVTDLLESPV